MAENWTKLAKSVGMVPIRTAFHLTGYWREPDDENVRRPVQQDALPAYLMEPAQTDRIMEKFKVSVRFDVEDCEWQAEALNANGDGCYYVVGPMCKTWREAVARCAAGLV